MLLNPVLCDEIIGGQHPGNSEQSRDADAAIGQVPVDWSAGGGRLDVSTSCLTVFLLSTSERKKRASTVKDVLPFISLFNKNYKNICAPQANRAV